MGASANTVVHCGGTPVFADVQRDTMNIDPKDIEKKMRKLLPSWKEMTGKEVTADQAREAFKGNPYKLELIEEIIAVVFCVFFLFST